MPKIPVISSSELIKVLEKIGFVVTSQRGSHIKLRHSDGRIAVVPNHRELKKGTLKKGILNPIGITVQEFIQMLNK